MKDIDISEKKNIIKMENKLENTEVMGDKAEWSQLYFYGNFISLIWISSKKQKYFLVFLWHCTE